MRLKEVENLIKGLEKGDIIFLKDKLVYTGLERYYRINQSTRELEYTDFDLKNNISNGDIDFADLAHVIKTGEASSSNTETINLLKELKNLTTFVEELGNMNGEAVGGCPLIKLKISDFIYPSSKIKWILKSWSFKPALQVTFDNNPIYVDFNVTLQTQYILSSTDFMSLLGIEPTA